MRVCARLSAVQQLKQQKAASDVVADGRQNGGQNQQQRKMVRKRSRANGSAQDDSELWHGSVVTRARRTAKPTAVEWQQCQQHGFVQAFDFDWDQYLTVRGGTAALNGHLFQQQHFMERTLAEHIFRPGSSVRVRCPQNGENDLWVSARIGITFPFGQAAVEIPTRTAPTEQTVRNGRIIGMDSGTVRTEIVQLSTMELPDETADDKGPAIEGAVYADFRTILRERREWLGRQLHTFIQEGQLFELQEAPLGNEAQPSSSSSAFAAEFSSISISRNNFLRVHVVRVVAHQNGLVLVERIGRGEEDGRPQRELMHITSERCHPLGWTRAQLPSDKYTLVGSAFEDTTPSVPRWIFSFRPLTTHKFEVGMLLEMLDPQNRLSFVPAFVSERVNSHYFKVRPIRNVQNLTALLRDSDHIVHCTSPDIFPVGWCFKNQIRLTFPLGLNHSDSPFSYAALRLQLRTLFGKPGCSKNDELASVFVAHPAHDGEGVQAVQHEQLRPQPPCPTTVPPTCSSLSPSFSHPFFFPMEFNFASDSLFDLPKMVQKRLECVRYCEVQDAADPTLFYPAAIVRSYQHLLWVHFDQSEEHNHRPAQIYTTNSPQLFRCGTAKKASVATDFSAATSLRYFTVPLRIPGTLSANCSWFLTRTFTSQRTPVFLVRPKPFLSEMWLKADLWLPPIHLSANCFCGPFLVADKVRALPSCYASSPLPHAISTLVKDLLACGAGGVGTRGVRELIDLVGADRASKAPVQLLLKLKYANRRVRFSVEACERAAQFPGWLRTLLIRLDACPNLLSLEERDKCPLNCSASLASSLYLTHGGHANTASVQSSQQQTNKLNQAAQQLKKVVQQQQQQQQKKRKNGRNKKAKKLEEEEETEYAVTMRQPSQPIPPRREPSKRLSIAQPVVDDDGYDDEEDNKAEEEDDGIGTDNGRKAAQRSGRRWRRKSNERTGEGGVVVGPVNNDDDDDDSNSKSTSSTTTGNTSSSSSSIIQPKMEGVVEGPTTKQTRQRQRSGRDSSGSSASTDSSDDTDNNEEGENGDDIRRAGAGGGRSSPISSSSTFSSTATTTTAAAAAAATAVSSSALSSAVTAPPRTPPPPAQKRNGQPTTSGAVEGRQQQRPQRHHPTAQQREIKQEQQRTEEDEVQWYDHQRATLIQNASQQQQHATVGTSAHNSDMDIVHVLTQQRQPQHYSTPMPIYTPYLYAAVAPPHQPYAYFYAPVAAPSAASSCSQSSSAAPPFLHHPPPPHVHLMPAPPPPPAMFAPLPSNAGAGTSANAASTISCASNSNIGGTSKFGLDCPPVDSNPSRWSAETLCQWLTAAGLVDCAQRLLDEEVDGACLLLFSPANYQKLGLKLGPMVKLQQMAEYLRHFTFADGR